jgi:hypothetical protein
VPAFGRGVAVDWLGIELGCPPVHAPKTSALLGGQRRRIQEYLVAPDVDVLGQRPLRLVEPALKKGCRIFRNRVCSGGSNEMVTSGSGLPSMSNAFLDE